MSEKVIESAHQQKAPIYVLIGIPCGDQVSAGFAHDLATLCGSMSYNRPDVDLNIAMMKGTVLPSQRTGLAYQALSIGATHLLFLDSDMRFPPDLLHKLLECKEPVVACNYVTRRFPIQPVSFLDPVGERRLYTTEDSTGLVPVSSTGLGATLIDTDVFRFVPQPWFPQEWVMEHGVDSVSCRFVPEDVGFFNKLRTAGINVLVHQDLSKHIRHEGSWEYSHDHALVQRGEVQGAEVASGPDHVVRDAANGSGIVVVEG